MIIPVRLKDRSYPIVLERGALLCAREWMDLDRKALVVTDEGVPKSYAEAIANQCKAPLCFTVPQGEGSKSLDTLRLLLTAMLEHDFSRKDCVVAVGGGVVSDLSGFAASCYMRGIDFYTVPTTVLAAVDASVGGKTAVNLCGVKNVVGAFRQPKAVLIDPDTFLTLPRRQVANGLSEAVKMALTSDRDLFSRFETRDPFTDLDEIVARSVRIKRGVVEQDETERNLRRVLNFGHTIGHGIESAGKGRYHGECVAIGMLPMCSEPVKNRLVPVLEKLGLPTRCDLDPAAVYAFLQHDKKAAQGSVSIVRVEEVGSFVLETVPVESLRARIESVTGREEA